MGPSRLVRMRNVMGSLGYGSHASARLWSCIGMLLGKGLYESFGTTYCKLHRRCSSIESYSALLSRHGIPELE